MNGGRGGKVKGAVVDGGVVVESASEVMVEVIVKSVVKVDAIVDVVLEDIVEELLKVADGRTKEVESVKTDPGLSVELSTGNGGIVTVVLVGCGDVLSENETFEVVVKEGADVVVNTATEVAIEELNFALVATEAGGML